MAFTIQRLNGVLRMSGIESVDLLNRLSTNRIAGREQGEVIETILTTEKGRIIDVLFAIIEDNGVLLITSPGKVAEVQAWLDKYTIMEDVRYADLTEQFFVYHTFEAEAHALLGLAPWQYAARSIEELSYFVFRHESLRGPGLVFVVPSTFNDRFNSIAAAGGITGMASPFSEEDFQRWRISRGFPDTGAELTELVNPLESGAGAAVDFGKGCYIGQEVIARLDSYDKVQRTLKRIIFTEIVTEPLAPGTVLDKDGKNAGFLTSISVDPEAGVSIGLGCIRHAFSAEGTELILHSEKSNYLCSVR